MGLSETKLGILDQYDINTEWFMKLRSFHRFRFNDECVILLKILSFSLDILLKRLSLILLLTRLISKIRYWHLNWRPSWLNIDMIPSLIWDVHTLSIWRIDSMIDMISWYYENINRW
jgi:hypothetical protein